MIRDGFAQYHRTAVTHRQHQDSAPPFKHRRIHELHTIANRKPRFTVTLFVTLPVHPRRFFKLERSIASLQEQVWTVTGCLGSNRDGHRDEGGGFIARIVVRLWR